MHRLVSKVGQAIRQFGLLSRGEKAIVAVSGGADSTALLHILSRLSADGGWELVVAHVNHMLRGSESDAEASFVQSLAQSLGWPLEMAHIDMPAAVSAEGGNGQSLAREKRYAFLLETARKYGTTKIMLAHHADDQAETVLMKLLRGAGPGGLAGMSMRRQEHGVELVRPLLRIYREEIEQFCAVERLAYCTDSSNASRKYMRNRIRLDVLPYLREVNPQISRTLVRLGAVMEAENDYMERQTREACESWVRLEAGQAAFSRKLWLDLHPALQRRCIKLILEYVFSGDEAGNYTAVELICGALRNSEPTSLTLDLDQGVRLLREYDDITVIREPDGLEREPREKQAKVLIGSQGTIPLTDAQAVLEWSTSEVTARTVLPENRWQAVFDAEQLALPLWVRTRRDGDKVHIYGLKGSKKVKDMFIDEKIPVRRRDSWPIVVDAQDRIIWIPGIRRSTAALVTAQTVFGLQLNLRKQGM